MNRPRKHSLSLTAIFAVPTAIFLLGVFGLVSALTGDGWRDWLSWLALGVPLVALVWAMRTRRS